jgi:hypothetical protein
MIMLFKIALLLGKICEPPRVFCTRGAIGQSRARRALLLGDD